MSFIDNFNDNVKALHIITVQNFSPTKLESENNQNFNQIKKQQYLAHRYFFIHIYLRSLSFFKARFKKNISLLKKPIRPEDFFLDTLPSRIFPTRRLPPDNREQSKSIPSNRLALRLFSPNQNNPLNDIHRYF